MNKFYENIISVPLPKGGECYVTRNFGNVEGMSCGHCKSAVESALNSIDGVTSADVNLENGQVSVQYDDIVAVSQMKMQLQY